MDTPPLTPGTMDKGGHNDWPSQVTERPAPPPAMRAGTYFSSTWKFGDRVHMDGDTSIKGIVTGFSFRQERAPTVEVSWFHNGDLKTGWLEESRLSLVPA